MADADGNADKHGLWHVGDELDGLKEEAVAAVSAGTSAPLGPLYPDTPSKDPKNRPTCGVAASPVISSPKLIRVGTLTSV